MKETNKNILKEIIDIINKIEIIDPIKNNDWSRFTEYIKCKDLLYISLEKFLTNNDIFEELNLNFHICYFLHKPENYEYMINFLKKLYSEHFFKKENIIL